MATFLNQQTVLTADRVKKLIDPFSSALSI
mgnify:CR=1 FL=1